MDFECAYFPRKWQRFLLHITKVFFFQELNPFHPVENGLFFRKSRVRMWLFCHSQPLPETAFQKGIQKKSIDKPFKIKYINNIWLVWNGLIRFVAYYLL